MSKLSQQAIFARIGFEMLLKPGKEGKVYRRLHVIFGYNFNKAFRGYFPNQDPREALKQLQKDDLVNVSLAKGGATFALEEVLLRPLTAAEEKIAENVRQYLAGYIAEHDAREAQGDKKPAPSAKALQAAMLLEEGKLSEAMKLLGL